MIALSVFSQGLYGRQPVRRLERSIKVETGGPGGPCRPPVTLRSCLGGGPWPERLPGPRAGTPPPEFHGPQKSPTVRSEDE